MAYGTQSLPLSALTLTGSGIFYWGTWGRRTIPWDRIRRVRHWRQPGTDTLILELGSDWLAELLPNNYIFLFSYWFEDYEGLESAIRERVQTHLRIDDA
jgi:hypothetical protein